MSHSYLDELEIFGAIDCGVPGKERISIRVNDEVDIGNFAMLVGIRSQTGGVTPLNDNFFWFGSKVLNEGDWIFVYTGSGNAVSSKLPNSEKFIHSVHWGRQATLFNHQDVVPILYKFGAIHVLDGKPTPEAAHQIKG